MAKSKRKPKATKRTAKPTGKPAGSPVFDEWKAGASIRDLAKKYNLKRNQIRKQLMAGAGSKEKFRELRAAGAGGSIAAFGGHRGGGRTKEVIALDDSKVPVLQSSDIKLKINARVLDHTAQLNGALDERLENEHKATPSERMRLASGFENTTRVLKAAKQLAKWKGWKAEYYMTRFGTQTRLLAPDGKTYVRASDTERADYIVDTGMERTRWKNEKEARLARTEEREQEQIERGKTALKNKRAAKRAARRTKA